MVNEVRHFYFVLYTARICWDSNGSAHLNGRMCYLYMYIKLRFEEVAGVREEEPLHLDCTGIKREWCLESNSGRSLVLTLS